MNAATGSLDRNEFPHLAAYLESLPVGLDSHPGCQVKTGIFRHFASSMPFAPAELERLPQALRRELEGSGAGESWMPEVHFMSALLAFGDLRRHSDTETQRWLLEANTTLLGGKIYRVLMSMGSPELLLPLSRIKWNTLRRGTALTVELGKKCCTATLQFPSRLYDKACLAVFVPAFAALLEVSNARQTRVELGACDETTAHYLGHWS